MKSLLIKQMQDEFGVRKIAGKKLKRYSFYTLLGFQTRMRKGEEVK